MMRSDYVTTSMVVEIENVAMLLAFQTRGLELGYINRCYSSAMLYLANHSKPTIDHKMAVIMLLFSEGQNLMPILPLLYFTSTVLVCLLLRYTLAEAFASWLPEQQSHSQTPADHSNLLEPNQRALGDSLPQFQVVVVMAFED